MDIDKHLSCLPPCLSCLMYLIVVVLMNELVIDKPSKSGRWVTHCVTRQCHTLSVWIVYVTGEAGDAGWG